MTQYKVHFSSLKRNGRRSIIPARAATPQAAIMQAREHFAPGVKMYPVKIEEV